MGDCMDYRVIINPELGGSETGSNYNGVSAKDYNLRFSKLLSQKLTDIGVSNTLVRATDKTMNNDDIYAKYLHPQIFMFIMRQLM